jgi:hypothetical protein
LIRGRLPAEVGALFKRALEAALDSLPIPQPPSPAGAVRRSISTSSSTP